MIKEISGEEFEATVNSQNTVVIDFFATWCGPCKAMSRIAESYSEGHPDVLFAKVDVDKNPELAKRFGVMSIPTLVFMKNGEEDSRHVGVMDEDELDEALA